MSEITPRCAHCGGTLFRDNDEVKCLSCSRVWQGKTELHQFYQEHRPEIVETVRKLGRAKAAECWQIPVGTMHHILANWGYSSRPPVPKTVTPGPESNSTGSNEAPPAAPPAAKSGSPGKDGPDDRRAGPPSLADLSRALNPRPPWSFTITEEDLAQLSDDDYWVVWYNLGKVVHQRAAREEVTQ